MFYSGAQRSFFLKAFHGESRDAAAKKTGCLSSHTQTELTVQPSRGEGSSEESDDPPPAMAEHSLPVRKLLFFLKIEA